MSIIKKALLLIFAVAAVSGYEISTAELDYEYASFYEYASESPTKSPSKTKKPTPKLTKKPTRKPTLRPTKPTKRPTKYPTKRPTRRCPRKRKCPVCVCTMAPTMSNVTFAPTLPSNST